MHILRAYKTELKLNNKERGLMIQYTDLSRFVFNWGLARRIEAYEADGTSLFHKDWTLDKIIDKTVTNQVLYSIKQCKTRLLDMVHFRAILLYNLVGAGRRSAAARP